MPARAIWQYILIVTAWIVALAAMSLPAVEMNGFLGWNGELNTQAFVKVLLDSPREAWEGWMGSAGRAGIAAVPATRTIELAWLGLVLAGFVVFLLAPLMVRRRNTWRRTGQTAIRCLAGLLWVLPLTTVAPRGWQLPAPHGGMYILSAAHLLVFAALALTPATPSPKAAFPIEGEKDSGAGGGATRTR
jgi:hypothetical protein